MKKIGFDFDGVIVELPEDYRKLSALLKDEKGFSDLIKQVVNSDVWKEYLRIAKPQKNIRRLRTLCRKYECHIISRRLESDLPRIFDWLNKNNIHIPIHRIHLRKDLRISPINFKKSKVIEIGLDEYWDDDEDIVNEIPNARKFTNWKDIE